MQGVPVTVLVRIPGPQCINRTYFCMLKSAEQPMDMAKILKFYFLNDLWQYFQNALKPRNPKFHKVLMISLQVMRVFVQIFTHFS
jgi:hypothetical protein